MQAVLNFNSSIQVAEMSKIPKQTFDEDSDDTSGAEMPIEPDEGSALIPDEERVINVPS